MVSLLRLQAVTLSIVVLTSFLAIGSTASPVHQQEDFSKIQKSFSKDFPSVSLAPFGSIVDKVTHYIRQYKDFMLSHASYISDPEEVKSFNETLKQFDLAIELCDAVGNLMKDTEGYCDPSDTYDLSSAAVQEIPLQPGGEKQLLLTTPALKYNGGICHNSDGWAGASYTQLTSEEEAGFINGALAAGETEYFEDDKNSTSGGDDAENGRGAPHSHSTDNHTLPSHFLSSGGGSVFSAAVRQVQNTANMALETLSQVGLPAPDIEAVVEGAPPMFMAFFSERQCKGGRSATMPQGLDILSSLNISLPEEMLHMLHSVGVMASDVDPKWSGAAVLSMRTNDSETLMAKLSEGVFATEGPKGKIRSQICAFTDNPEAFKEIANVAERGLVVMAELLFSQLTGGSVSGSPPVETEPADSSSTVSGTPLPSMASPASSDNRDLSSDQGVELPEESGTGTTNNQESAESSTTATTTAVPATLPATETTSTVSTTSSGSSSETLTEAACFPGDAVVELEDGTHLPMRELRVGDSVRSSRSAFSKVILFTHADREAETEFVSIEAGSPSRAIALSPGHYLPSHRAGEGWKLVAAASVSVGDLIISGNAEDGAGEHLEVTAVTRTRASGLFNPQTVSGSIVVNGVSASTYTTAVPVALAKTLLMPLSLASDVLGVVFPSLSVVFREGAAGLAGILPEGTSRLDL